VTEGTLAVLPESDVLAPAAPGRERLAALDVGSNSIRLLVAEYDAGAGLTVVDEVKDQPRLAQGVATTGHLDTAAMERAMAGLARMRVVCQRRGVRRIAAVATSAVREASNGEEFVQRVRDELGIPLRIIDAETEAALSWRSVKHHFRMDGARTIVADIGGGSLELIGAVDGLVESTVSMPLGAVRLTETHLGRGKDVRREVASLRKHVRKVLRKGFPWREWTNPVFLGSGGTFTNLGRMAIGRRGLPVPDSIHGTNVPTGEVPTHPSAPALRYGNRPCHVLAINRPPGRGSLPQAYTVPSLPPRAANSNSASVGRSRAAQRAYARASS